eukprot:Skav229646  [mRNA]  locus=scaffold649:353155:353475:+ [translate_table: standard]
MASLESGALCAAATLWANSVTSSMNITLFTYISESDPFKPIWIARRRSISRGTLPSPDMRSRSGSHWTRPLEPPPPVLHWQCLSSSAADWWDSFTFRILVWLCFLP